MCTTQAGSGRAGGRTSTAPLPTAEQLLGGAGAGPPVPEAVQRQRRRMRFVSKRYHELSLPIAVLFLFWNRRIHPSYAMTWRRKLLLAWRMFRATRNIQTGTSYLAHLAMAAKLLEVPPKVKGVVVECGCWLGGSTACLSLVCDIVGRDLVVYDSFEGLPAPTAGDKYATPFAEGYLRGELEEVRENVRRWGAVERCQFRKGWFADTLPQHAEPIVLAFLDVDFEASMYDCVVNLWPHLTEKGYVFMDEFVRLDYCAIFFSERFWREEFGTDPPGLVGAGSGIGVGQYFLGPFAERPQVQAPTSVAYTRKDFYGRWDYERAPAPEVATAPAAPGVADEGRGAGTAAGPGA
jgi:O-methyltransferase